MSMQKSYNMYEREYNHMFREGLNKSENSNDIFNLFAYDMKKMMNQISCGMVNCKEDDIMFDPESNNHFVMSENLMQKKEFNNMMMNSDLMTIMKRFADMAYNRYCHMSKHMEKTKLKIKGMKVQ